MSTWYSRILTNTSTSISNLQSRILASENDGDTEDDTHTCRVLRAYYTEKGRPFPAWLPPDPKAPPPVAPVYAQSQSQVGSRYGGMGQQQGNAPGSLSSLWDKGPDQQVQNAPPSLRQGRGGAGMDQGGASRLSPFAAQDGAAAGGRPQPGQRAGSYQSSNPYARNSSGTPPGGAAGGGGSGGGGSSAQDRLKQRLWGGSRTVSPGSTGPGPFQPPGGRGGGGGGGGDYEDRFAPGGMYDSGSRGGGGGGKPTMSANMSSNAPWNADDEFANFSGGGYGGGGGRQAGGLPSGPRRGNGLPSGPRMR